MCLFYSASPTQICASVCLLIYSSCRIKCLPTALIQRKLYPLPPIMTRVSLIASRISNLSSTLLSVVSETPRYRALALFCRWSVLAAPRPLPRHRRLCLHRAVCSCLKMPLKWPPPLSANCQDRPSIRTKLGHKARNW